MKITAGLGSVEEYERFVRAGADEFFSGYVPYEWGKEIWDSYAAQQKRGAGL